MNTVKRPAPLAAALLILLHLAGAARAERDPTDPFKSWKGENQTGEFNYDDSQDKPWHEIAGKVPPLPADDDLLPVRVDSLTRPLQAHMGAASLSYNPQDRVLRYWLVITSPAGAYNATYEGLRCDTMEYKVYAYGNPRRTPPVQLATGTAWQKLGNIKPGTYRPEMMRTLLCNESNRPRPLRDILDTLRGNRAYRNPSADNSDF